VKAANSNFQVKDLKCFDLKCKKKIENYDQLVKQISNKDIAQRYDYLKKKQEVHLDKNKFICPNEYCKKVIDSQNQESVRGNYETLEKRTYNGTAMEMKDITNLDYSFLVCDECNNVFCKICEVYHEPGKASCQVTKNITSDILIKVNHLFFIEFFIQKLLKFLK
jgi:hypothetical protein